MRSLAVSRWAMVWVVSVTTIGAVTISVAQDKTPFTVTAPKEFVLAYVEAVTTHDKRLRPSSAGYLAACCGALKEQEITAVSLRGIMRQCTPKILAECVGLHETRGKGRKGSGEVTEARRLLRPVRSSGFSSSAASAPANLASPSSLSSGSSSSAPSSSSGSSSSEGSSLTASSLSAPQIDPYMPFY